VGHDIQEEEKRVQGRMRKMQRKRRWDRKAGSGKRREKKDGIRKKREK
jgi:hypothetical protein